MPICLELAVAGGCNAIHGGLLVELVGLVAREEEGVGTDNGEAHPCVDEPCYVKVCVAPLLCKQPGNASFSR